MRCEKAGLPAVRTTAVMRVDQADLVSVWLSGRNPRTLAAYNRDIEDFARFLGAASGGQAIEALIAMSQGAANGVVLNYCAHLRVRDLAPATIARRLAALRSLVKLARMLGRVSWSLDVEAPRVERWRDTSGPGLNGWRAILAAAQKRAVSSISGIRDLAMVRLLHDLGLRRGEVSALTLNDYDSEFGRIQILGKGRRQKEALTVPAPCGRDLKAWIDVRGTEPGPLFVRLDPARDPNSTPGLSGESIRQIVQAIAKLAGIHKVVRPHGLRHQAITSVLDRNGGDVRAAARFSRHQDLNTLIYYDDNRSDLAGVMAGLISDD